MLCKLYTPDVHNVPNASSCNYFLTAYYRLFAVSQHSSNNVIKWHFHMVNLTHSSTKALFI